MSAQPAYARRGFLAAVLARAEAFLLEPLDEVHAVEPVVRVRPVVAVFGLGEGCGATTVARGLGAALAGRDPEGACAVSASRRPAALPLGTAPAARLARTLETRGSWAQASGRLCLVESADLGQLAETVRYLAPLVIDGGSRQVGGTAAAVADHVVLVASARVEPALASVTRASLATVGPDPLLVLNRVSEPGAFAGRADLLLPDSRMGAQLAQAGREPRAELGRAISELAGRCEEPRQ